MSFEFHVDEDATLIPSAEEYKSVLELVERAYMEQIALLQDEMYQRGYGDGYRAAQAEIVRCKDCKWWDCYGGDDSHKGDCIEHNLDCCMYEDDFCSCAERKDDAENH